MTIPDGGQRDRAETQSHNEATLGQHEPRQQSTSGETKKTRSQRFNAAKKRSSEKKTTSDNKNEHDDESSVIEAEVHVAMFTNPEIEIKFEDETDVDEDDDKHDTNGAYAPIPGNAEYVVAARVTYPTEPNPRAFFALSRILLR